MGGFNVSEWAIRHAALTRYLLVLLLVGGIYAYFKLGQNEDPDFTFRVKVITANLPGASPEQVELQLTNPIERKLQETPWLDKVRSYSKAGEALIFVYLKGAVPPRDVPEIWYQVRKKIGDIRNTLPEGAVGPFYNDEFGDVFGSIYAFTADGFTHSELRDYVEAARQRLLKLKNVAKIDLVGVQDDRIFIELSQQKFAALGLNVERISQALATQIALLTDSAYVARITTESGTIHWKKFLVSKGE